MMRFALLAAFGALMAAPAGAQTPPPGHVYHHTAVQHQASPMRFTNPSGGSGPHPMNGQGCIGPHANAAQTTINPINGKPQAATIVAIPLSKGAGGVASATNRAQQAQACAQSRAH
jgi:hypothetical protein